MTWMQILRRRLGLAPALDGHRPWVERVQGGCSDESCTEEHPVFWNWR